MNSISEQVVDGRRRRRTHSPEFKANAVAACMQLGVSIPLWRSRAESMPICCGAGCRLRNYAPTMLFRRSHPASQSRLRHLYRKRLATGARLNEALHARWEHVDRATGMWRIPALNSKSKRQKTLPLNDSAQWVLKELGTSESSPFLFPSPVTGVPFTNITRVWYRLRTKAGIPAKTRIHDLRHTFASRVVSAGRSLFEVQKLLGHSDPRTSQRYAHLSMKSAQEASNTASFIS